MSKSANPLEEIFGDKFPTLQIIRCGAGEQLSGTVTTSKVWTYFTHWSGGRTVGHVYGICPGCEASIALDFNAYVGFYGHKSRSHRLLNLTKGAVQQIYDARGSIWNTRGLQLQLSRQKGAINRKLMAQCGMTDSCTPYLPADFSVSEHLARIWGVEYVATVCRSNGIEWNPLDPFPRKFMQLLITPDSQAEEQKAVAIFNDLDGQTYLPESR